MKTLLSFGRVGIVFRPLGESFRLLGLARLAEAAGFHSVWLVETDVNRSDAFVLAAALSMETTRVKIATGVVNIYTRTATAISRAALNLSSLSSGRFILGIGSGAWHVYGLSQPLQRLRETVGLIRQELGGSITPMYVAALGPNAVRLAASIGDGVLFHLSTKYYLKQAIEIVKDVLRSKGWEEKKLDVACYLMTIVSDNADEAYMRARAMIARYATVQRYAEHLRRMGFKQEVEEIQEKMNQGIEDAAEHVPRRMVDELTIYGEPKKCVEKITEYSKLGVSLPIIYPYMKGVNDYPQTIKKTIEQLAQYLH